MDLWVDSLMYSFHVDVIIAETHVCTFRRVWALLPTRLRKAASCFFRPRLDSGGSEAIPCDTSFCLESLSFLHRWGRRRMPSSLGSAALNSVISSCSLSFKLSSTSWCSSVQLYVRELMFFSVTRTSWARRSVECRLRCKNYYQLQLIHVHVHMCMCNNLMCMWLHVPSWGFHQGRCWVEEPLLYQWSHCLVDFDLLNWHNLL